MKVCNSRAAPWQHADELDRFAAVDLLRQEIEDGVDSGLDLFLGGAGQLLMHVVRNSGASRPSLRLGASLRSKAR